MMVKRYAETLAKDMALKYPNVRYMRTQDFEMKIKDLKAIFSDGKIDEALALKTDEVLWSYLSDSGIFPSRKFF